MDSPAANADRSHARPAARPGTRFWIAVFVVAAIVRMGYAAWRDDPYQGAADAHDYQQLAVNVAEHGVLSKAAAPPLRPSAYREPGYPLFLAACYRVFGVRPMAAVFVQTLLGTFGVVLFCAITLALCRAALGREPRPFLIVALAFIAYVALAMLSTNWSVLMREDLQNTVALAVVWLGLSALTRPRWTCWLSTGVLIGVGALLKATMGVLLPVFLLLLWIARPARSTLVPTAAITAIIAAILAPAIVRNHRQFGVNSLAATTGMVLYLHSGQPSRLEGVEPQARRIAHDLAARWPDIGQLTPAHRAGLDTEPGFRYFGCIIGDVIAERMQVTPEQADEMLKRIVIQDVRRDPQRWAGVTASHLLSYLTGGLLGGRPYPPHMLKNRSTPVRIYRTVVQPARVMGLEALSLVGLWRLRRSPGAWMLFLAGGLTLLGHCVVSDGQERYRVLTDVMFAPLALTAIVSVSARLPRHGRGD